MTSLFPISMSRNTNHYLRMNISRIRISGQLSSANFYIIRDKCTISSVNNQHGLHSASPPSSQQQQQQLIRNGSNHNNRQYIRLQSTSKSQFNNKLSNQDDDYYDSEYTRRNQKVALVIGSSGSLGTVVAKYLSQTLGMKVFGADVTEVPRDKLKLDAFIQIHKQPDTVQDDNNTNTTSTSPSLSSVTTDLVRGVHGLLADDTNTFDDTTYGLDVIICANGGWMSDPKPLVPEERFGVLSEEEVLTGAMEYTESVQQMFQQNIDPVIAAGFISQYYMNKDGLVVVLGATAALAPTPGMMGYGLAKAGAHHFVQTAGASTGKSIVSKSQRKVGREVRRNTPALDTLTYVGILPTTLDTRSGGGNNNKNKKNAANSAVATTSTGAKPLQIALEIGTWIETPALRPHSGSLVKVNTKPDGTTTFELVR